MEKTKTYQNVSEQASIENLATVGAALAGLYDLQWIGSGVTTQEIIQN